MVLDQVFRKEVNATTRFVKGYKGKVYYFCSVCSKKLFEVHPEKYSKIKYKTWPISGKSF